MASSQAAGSAVSRGRGASTSTRSARGLGQRNGSQPPRDRGGGADQAGGGSCGLTSSGHNRGCHVFRRRGGAATHAGSCRNPPWLTEGSLTRRPAARGRRRPIAPAGRAEPGEARPLRARRRHDAARGGAPVRSKRVPAHAVTPGEDAADLAELDENLVRAELAAAQLAHLGWRRQQAYERLHPEAAAGTAGGLASGRARAGGNGATGGDGRPEDGRASDTVSPVR